MNAGSIRGGGGGLHVGHSMRKMIDAPEEKPQITRDLIKRVIGYAKPYRGLILGMLAVILTTTGLGLLTPLIMRQMIDHTIPNGDLRQLAILAGVLLLVPSTAGLLNVLQRRLNARVGEGVIYDLRVGMYDRLQRMSLRFFTHTKVGELMSRLNNDVVGAQNAISSTLVSAVTQTIQLAAVLVVMATLEWRLTIISMIIFPLFIVASRFLGSRLRLIAWKQMEANAQMNAMMSETLNIGGAPLVKLFGRQRDEVGRFSNRSKDVRNLGIDRATMGSTFMAIVGLISAVGTALVYGLGGYFVIQGAFTIGTIVAFGAYLHSLYTSLQGLANVPVEFATSVVSFERVFEVIDFPVELPEIAEPVELKDVKGEIRFDNVSFQYETGHEVLLSDVKRRGSVDSVTAVLSGGENPPMAEAHMPGTDETSQARGVALRDISFTANPGELVALVGPSGAGKTTLTYLIPRLYDPTEGTVRLDGVDLRDLSLRSLTGQIGMVTQETYLFHDTIRTNLLYAKLDATQEEMETACRIANIHYFIAALPDGYDTIVGERGYRLSGGEKQRLALARVILKNPRILVLDEATSNLDSESEALIQDALNTIMADRTSIVIAHRLSTILAADLILVLDRGQIVERGTHEQLLTQGGLYATLYDTQFNKEGKE
ncbi:MAG TPA: ABC transporter ATP-binding protein [Bellilinea sp.]|nr:ABC transporter ATP-binding protein [Bellilinea sp.]